LAPYRAVLSHLYPQHGIRAALLWTETPDLMEISAPALDAGLASLSSRGEPACPGNKPFIRSPHACWARFSRPLSCNRTRYPMAVGKVSDADFEAEVLKARGPVVVDFWAEWCGPCRMIAPALDEIAGAMGEKVKIVKLNVDENPGVAAK